MIRPYSPDDYEGVIDLIKLSGLPEVTKDELEGYGLVWDEDGKILGYLWVLIGSGTAVYVDHFCVHPDHRFKDETGRSRIAVSLMLVMLKEMMLMEKTRVSGVLQNTPYGQSLERIYNAVGMKCMQPHAFVFGNVKDIFTKLKAMRHE